MLTFLTRRNGRRMATVQVSHYIGGLEVFKILCRRAPDLPYGDRDEQEKLPWPRMSRASVEKLVRENLRGRGVDAYFGEDDWSQNFEVREIGRIARWADGEIRRLHPTLIDDAYTAYAQDLIAADEETD